MKLKFFSFLSVLCIVFSSCFLTVFASESSLDGYTIQQESFDYLGNQHVIASDSTGEFCYLINGVRQINNGLVFVGGYYYYVRSTGYLFVGDTRNINSVNSNGYLEDYVSSSVVGISCTFDSFGRMVDPPAYPDNWEKHWTYVPPSGAPMEPVSAGLSVVISWFGIIADALLSGPLAPLWILMAVGISVAIIILVVRVVKAFTWGL